MIHNIVRTGPTTKLCLPPLGRILACNGLVKKESVFGRVISPQSRCLDTTTDSDLMFNECRKKKRTRISILIKVSITKVTFLENT